MKLTTEERRAAIRNAVHDSGRVRVAELSKLYGISEVSIRADLAFLENEGAVTRVHGGAVRVEKQYMNMDADERLLANVTAKKALAAKVAELVNDNDTIMMNAGTTLSYVLRALNGKKNISVVTNSIPNAAEASTNPQFNVILLGGLIDGKYRFTFGQDAIRQLDNYHAVKCILSLDGISTSSGLTLYYPNEADLIHKMMNAAGTVIVAADSSKIGKNTFTKISSIARMNILVTDRNPQKAEQIAALRAAGITVYEA